MSSFPWITLLTFLPFVGGIIVIGLDGNRKTLARRLALAFSLATLAVAILVWLQFDPGLGGLQFVEQHKWIPILGVDYFVGIDGLSLPLLLLAGLVTPMAILASRGIRDRVPVYFGLMLFLLAGLVGTFTALNFFHWFLFWELSLIPGFFLIRLWGGPGRGPAATQFFVYTMAGSVTLLLAFLAIFLVTGKFNFPDLAGLGRDGAIVTALSDKLGWRELNTKPLALIIFAGAFLGFAVKVPLAPFHTWLPPAYAEAPTGTAMLLTGLMSKMGLYGFLRIVVPLFPMELRWVLKPLLVLAVVTVVYSAAAAFAQRDLKRMLAYSSINHLGYCLLGIFAVMGSGGTTPAPLFEKAAALNGVCLLMFNHGLTAATLFWFAGLIEERAGGLRGLGDFGGLRKVAPVFCGLFGIALFSSLGLPGLNSFPGEFLIFKGVFPLVKWAAALSLLGLLITAVFILTMTQRIFHGPLNQKWVAFPDLTRAERLMFAPAIVLMFLLGVYPQALIRVINQTVVEIVQHLMF